MAGTMAETRGHEVCSTSFALPQQLRARTCLYSSTRGPPGRILRRSGTVSGLDGRRMQKVAAGSSYPELDKIANEEADKGGVDQLMKVSFRQVETFNLWLWFELYKPATNSDRELLETVLESWFVIGRMGGFNSMNMQVSQEAVAETRFFRYESEETETAMQALFMDYSEVESRGKWCRFWINMGTADEVALDVLINALAVFSRENLGIKQLIVGGVNEDWPVPDREDQIAASLKGLEGFEGLEGVD